MNDTPMRVIVGSQFLNGPFEAELRDLDDLRRVLMRTGGSAHIRCPEIYDGWEEACE